MEGWKKALVGPQATIEEAIRVIDQSSLQICLVVSEDGILLGTITDGDIRRGILRGTPLSASVEAVMNREFRKAGPADNPEQLMAMMRASMIRQLPVCDSHGVLRGLVTDMDFNVGEVRKNWVVLMAGGLGNRLKPLTDDTPKPLLKVGRKPLLETILENFLAYNFRNFYISVNYKADQVKAHFGDGSQWGCTIRYLEENERMGTAGALGLLPEVPTAPIVVMNGDVLTKVNFANLLQFSEEQGAQATMCVREYDFQVPYGVVNIEKHRIASLVEKPIHSFFVNAGIYVIDPVALDLLPKGMYFDMTDLFGAIIADGRLTSAFPVREYWIDIGRLDDFERANGDFPIVFG